MLLRPSLTKAVSWLGGAPPSDGQGPNDQLDTEIGELREQVKRLEGLDDCKEQLAKRKEQLAGLYRQKAAGRPYHQQVRDAQGRVDRKAKQLEKKK